MPSTWSSSALRRTCAPVASSFASLSPLIVTTGTSIPDADVRLTMTRGEWEGLGPGHGRLQARRVEVVATGRGAAARERRTSLWLPAPGGGVRLAGESPSDRVQLTNADAG